MMDAGCHTSPYKGARPSSPCWPHSRQVRQPPGLKDRPAGGLASLSIMCF